ncbi:MAG TPA: class I SAM-dependent methyltransferase [Magnetospirillaceae bacterium]|jgi:predicted O-methyltransferase YrrM
MSILPKLFQLYVDAGYQPLTGYNSYFFQNYRAAPFTKLVKGGQATSEWGLALQEIMFLEHFGTYLKPKRVFVIGNAEGWSTIALALTFPDGKVVGIDPNSPGNQLTNQIARKNGLTVQAVDASSPGDVKAVCDQFLDGPIDLALIDGVHQPENMVVDFEAVQARAAPDAIFVFHDVMIWNLVDTFHALREKHGLQGRILTRTPSGMAVAWRTASPDFVAYIEAFTEAPNVFKSYRRLVLDHQVDRLYAATDALK